MASGVSPYRHQSSSHAAPANEETDEKQSGDVVNQATALFHLIFRDLKQPFTPPNNTFETMIELIQIPRRCTQGSFEYRSVSSLIVALSNQPIGSLAPFWSTLTEIHDVYTQLETENLEGAKYRISNLWDAIAKSARSPESDGEFSQFPKRIGQELCRLELTYAEVCLRQGKIRENQDTINEVSMISDDLPIQDPFRIELENRISRLLGY